MLGFPECIDKITRKIILKAQYIIKSTYIYKCVVWHNMKIGEF